jgi:hypothetical protein
MVKTTAPEIIRDIMQRAGHDVSDYVITGHPDTYGRDGLRREVKAYGDILRPDQRKQLEWMTTNHQPWEILQETREGPVLVFRNLAVYDRYKEFRGSPRYGLVPRNVAVIRAAVECGENRKTLAKAFNISPATIDNIINRKHCSHR